MLQKKTAALPTLSLILTLMLAGCLNGEPQNTPTPTEEPAEALADLGSYDYAYEKYPAGEPIMSINGYDVLWGEYFYWINSVVSELEYYIGDMSLWNWDEAMDELDGMSVADIVNMSVDDTLRRYYALETNAVDAGATLSETDMQTLDETWQSAIDDYGAGDEQALLEYFNSIYLNRELFERLNRVSLLYLNCYELLYGKLGVNLPDKDAMDFAEENGYIQAKHILIKMPEDSPVNLDGWDELTEEEQAEKLAQYEDEIAAKKQLAEDLLARLESASDDEKAALFDELITEYGEDPGMEFYPDGYCFAPGTMVQEFYDGANALEDGGVSGIVETQFGYHIIMRVTMTPNSVVDYVSEEDQYNLRYYASVSYYEAMVDDWVNNAVIEYYEGFENFSFNELYEVAQ